MSTSPVSTADGSALLSMSAPTSSVNQSSRTVTTPPAASGSSHGSSNGGGLGSMSTSTSLYLYTFLATLLLLSISSAIILRSLVLRRRHLHLVQEAIRNGTLIPPTPNAFAMRGRSRRTKVDPRMRPKIWEAVVVKGETDVQGKLEWDWDSIKPFSATAVRAPSSESQVRPIEAASSNLRSEPTATTTCSSRRNNLSFVWRVINFLDHSPSSPSSPLPGVGMQNHTSEPTAERPDVNEPRLRSGPHNVRVAILIAMPSQSTPRPTALHSISSLNPASQPSTDPPLRPSLLFESSPLGQSQPAAQAGTEGLGLLPYVEFGIAEVSVRQNQDAVGDVSGRTGSNRLGVAKGSADSVDVA